MMDTREIVISGPYTLSQGGEGLIARKAIFLPGEDGEDKFWGFVSVIIDMEGLSKVESLDELSE